MEEQPTQRITMNQTVETLFNAIVETEAGPELRPTWLLLAVGQTYEIDAAEAQRMIRLEYARPASEQP